MKAQNKANQIRQEAVRVALENGKGHIAPSLSCIEILTVLYYQIMSDNDKLVFSKAHGCYGLYAILYDLGFIDREKWNTFDLPGCASTMPGVAFANGSLGHGLPVAAGIAFGWKLQRLKHNVFCVLGDGEMQEGSNWEAIQFAVKHELSNLTIIVDDNGLQAMDYTTKVMGGGLIKKLRGFELDPWVCDGHDIVEVELALYTMINHRYKIPNVLIAETVKGKGLPCMEGVPRFHFRLPGCVREE